LQISATNAGFVLAGPAETSPNSFSVTPPAMTYPATASLTAQAQFPDPTVCQQLGAQCSTSFPVSVSTPYALDDWSTYAHDPQRTGYQSQYTGISPQTAGSLGLVWSTKLDSKIWASPLVYNGIVIAVSFDGIVYELDAQTGAIIWKTTLPISYPTGATSAQVRGTPTIDGNLLFVGNSYKGAEVAGNYPPYPSDVFALNLTTGSVLWTQRLPGNLRGQPLAIGGRLYIGTAGGDPPTCLQGGMQALDESTGQVLWSWVVSPVANNGGSSWSAVTYDGVHIVFGTGNTCTQAEPAAQAVVALNPADGSVAWVFQPHDDQNNSDTDVTGVNNDQAGGISYVNGSYYLENKDGHLYILNGSGELQSTSSIDGLGTIATPTTDGTTTIVADDGAMSSPADRRKRVTEFYLDAPKGVAPRFLTPQGIRPMQNLGSSAIVAFDLAGNRRWSVPSNEPVYEFAAINGGVTFAGLNGTLAAFNLQTGQQLWSYASAPASDYFLGGPVIVPSGVYATDMAGYVYAFRLSSSPADRRHASKRPNRP
jgi:outer membrane protein assembly factor BamB